MGFELTRAVLAIRLSQRAWVERACAALVAPRDVVPVHRRVGGDGKQLVGKRLEVCWPYKLNGKTAKIWASGRVNRVADGLTDTKSARSKKLLPAGAVLWAWDADPDFDEQAGEQWLFLLPKKWNPTTHKQVYSWRYDPRELGAAQANAPEGVTIEQGGSREFVPARTVVWGAGVAGNALGARLAEAVGLETDRGGRLELAKCSMRI